MAHKFPKKAIREAIGALDELDVPPTDIHNRLVKGTAGLDHPLDISLRSVYYHRDKYRQEKKRAAIAEGATPEVISAAKHQAVDLLTRELDVHSRKAPGTLNATDIAAVERLHLSLDRIEKRSEKKPPGRPPKLPASSKADKANGKEETPLERLAREEKQRRDRAAAGEPSTPLDIRPASIPAA